jgi:trans-aconitate methyltransferase
MDASSGCGRIGLFVTESFETRRFRTAAAHYLAGRPHYSPRLIRRVVELTRLTLAHRVLDLGCGPGLLTLAFAPYAREILGVDPEPEMLRAARAREAPANVRWMQASSDDLGPAFSRFFLTVMGRSFHWMDRAETLRRLDALIEPGGAIALFGDEHPEVPDNAWRARWRALIDHYAGDDPWRGRERREKWVRHEAVLLDSAFSEVERVSVIERRQVTTETLIERALSMSSTSRARLGERADAMVAEMRALLVELAPSGELTEVLSTGALIARRAG